MSLLTESIDLLLKPKSVAVIGASRNETKAGFKVINYLKMAGYAGRIYPVNTSAENISGIRCFPSIGDLPEAVDCAFLSIPAASAPEAVKACVAAGARSLIIGSSGFAEEGSDEGRRRQDAIHTVLEGTGIRMIGPNSNGVYNAYGGVALGYNASHGDPVVRGNISVAAHSGALFNGFYPQLRSFGGGLSKFVPVGNEADLDILDFFDYFLTDPETDVICLILESLPDVVRFKRLAIGADKAGKPVVALKLGSSAEGAAAALAHSSRLAGSGRAYAALFRDLGVVQVDSIEVLASAAALLSSRPARNLQRKPLIGVTTSGGGGALIADHAARHDIRLVGSNGQWGGRTAERIAEFAAGGLVRNPIDLGNLDHHGLLNDLFRAQEVDGEDGPVAVFAHRLPSSDRDVFLAKLLIQRQQRIESPIIVLSPGGLGEDAVAVYREARVPVFRDTGTAFGALRAWYDHGRQVNGPGDLTQSDAVDCSIIWSGRSGGVLDEIESSDLLRAAGIPMVSSLQVRSAYEASEAAEALGYPVVLKAVPEKVAHKAKLGLVKTRISDASTLTRNYELLEQRLGALSVAADAVRFIVQPMVDSDLELIAGVVREPGLGLYLVIGLGGVVTEIIDEVIMFPVPASMDSVTAHLGCSRLGRIIDSFVAGRFDWKTALSAILRNLEGFAKANDERMVSVEINPLLLLPNGFVAVDGLVVSKGNGCFEDV